MKVRYVKNTISLCLTQNKVYEVLSVERGWYRIVDDSGEDYLYPPEHFETVRENSHDKDRIDSEN
jgi:hypothetical protein